MNFKTLILGSLLSLSVLPASAVPVNYGDHTCIHYDTGHTSCFKNREGGLTQWEQEQLDLIAPTLTRQVSPEQRIHSNGLYPSSVPQGY